MGAPVALLLHLLGVGQSLLRAIVAWVFGRWERPVMIVLGVMVIQYAALVVPGLEQRVANWKQATLDEASAHKTSKANYAQAILDAEEIARAEVAAEMERQGNEGNKAIALDRRRTHDLDQRAERLRRTYDGATIAGASCRANLPAPVAHSGGASDAAGAVGFSRAAGSNAAIEPAGLIGPSMSIEERVRCTRYASQLDAILDIDEANGQAAKQEAIKGALMGQFKAHSPSAKMRRIVLYHR